MIVRGLSMRMGKRKETKYAFSIVEIGELLRTNHTLSYQVTNSNIIYLELDHYPDPAQGHDPTPL